MIIETAFSINQSVWSMHDNKPVERLVYEIHVGVLKSEKRETILYGVGKYSVDRVVEHVIPEPLLFQTKELLLKSL